MMLNPNAIEFIPSSSCLTSRTPSSLQLSLSNSNSSRKRSNKNTKKRQHDKKKDIQEGRTNKRQHDKKKAIQEGHNNIWLQNEFPSLTISDSTIKSSTNSLNGKSYAVILNTSSMNNDDIDDDDNDNSKVVITNWDNHNDDDNNDDNDSNNSSIDETDNDINTNDADINTTTTTITTNNTMMRRFSGLKKFEERWIVLAKEIGDNQRAKNNGIRSSGSSSSSSKHNITWHQILSPVIKYDSAIYDDINSDEDNDSNNNADINTDKNTYSSTSSTTTTETYSESDWIAALTNNNNDMINTIILSGFVWIHITIDDTESNTSTTTTDDAIDKPNKISSLQYCAKHNFCLCLELLVSPSSSLSSSFDIDSRDRRFKMTALHRAALHGHHEVMQILLNKGSDPSCLDKIGESCLHKAVRSSSHRCVMLLINTNKVKVNHKNRRRENAMLLCRQKDIAHLLLAAGSEIDAQNVDGDDILIVTARRGDNKLLSTLINCNSLNRIQYKQLLQNNEGQFCTKNTALHEVCKWGHQSCLKTLISSELYDIDSTSHPDMATPLVVAALSGNSYMVKSLLDAKASPTIECSIGYNALVAALISKNTECVQLIIRYHPTILKSLNEYKENCLDILIKYIFNNTNSDVADNEVAKVVSYVEYISVITRVVLEGLTLTRHFIMKICHSENSKFVENFFNHNHYDINTTTNTTNTSKLPIYFCADIRTSIGHEDVIIFVKNNKLLAHAFVLQHVSSVFHKMINSDSPHRDEQGKVLLHFPSNEYHEFELLLDWIYTRKDVTINVNSDVLLSLLLLSSSLEILQLQYLCEARIAVNFKSYDKAVLTQLSEALQLTRLPVLSKIQRKTNINAIDNDNIIEILNYDEEKWLSFLIDNIYSSCYDITNTATEKRKAVLYLNIQLSTNISTTEINKKKCLQKVEVANQNILKIYHSIDNDDNTSSLYSLISQSLLRSTPVDKVLRKVLYEEPYAGWDNEIRFGFTSSFSDTTIRSRVDEMTPSELLMLNFKASLYASLYAKDVYMFAIDDENNKSTPVKANRIIISQCGKLSAMLRFQEAQRYELPQSLSSTSKSTSEEKIACLEIHDISFESMSAVIGFLYTGILRIGTVNVNENDDPETSLLTTLIELLFISEEYLIPTLKDHIEMMLLAILNNSNCKFLFSISKTLNMKMLALSAAVCYLINRNSKKNITNLFDNDEITENELIEMMIRMIMTTE